MIWLLPTSPGSSPGALRASSPVSQGRYTCNEYRLPGMFFAWLFEWMVPSRPSRLSSNPTFLREAVLAHLLFQLFHHVLITPYHFPLFPSKLLTFFVITVTDRMFASLSNSYGEALTPNMVVLEGREETTS